MSAPNRPTWFETYIEIAKVISKRSKDPHTKVGAVLVKDGCVIGVGYNGEPRNCSVDFNWNSEEKYDYVVHAEMNAIANACSIGVSCVGADIFITMSPCHDCLKLLIQHKIKNIYFLTKYKDFELTEKIAKNSQINLIQLKTNYQSLSRGDSLD
jgi:dCMP deaminase